MADIEVLTGGTQTNGANNGNNVTLTFPTLQENDVVVVFGGHYPRGGSTSAIPSGYSTIYDSGNGGSAPHFGVSYKRMGATPDTTVSCPGSGNAADGTAYACYCLRNVNTTTLEDATRTINGPTTSNDPDPPSIDTVTDGAMVLALILDHVAGTADTAVTVPSGYSNQRHVRGADNNDATASGATKLIASHGTENPGAFTNWADAVPQGTWRGCTVAIRPVTTAKIMTIDPLSVAVTAQALTALRIGLPVPTALALTITMQSVTLTKTVPPKVMTVTPLALRARGCVTQLRTTGTAAVSEQFFSLHILEPTKSGLLWPPWSPTSLRMHNNYGAIPPNYYYNESISYWGAVETAKDTFNWALYDAVWPKLIDESVSDVMLSFYGIPGWAQYGNWSTQTVTMDTGTDLVTATNSWTIEGMGLFFRTDGALPSPLVQDSWYYAKNYNDTNKTYQLSSTRYGSPIDLTGSQSGTHHVTTLDTAPADLTDIYDWVTAALTHAAAQGIAIKFVEGLNEANNFLGFNLENYAGVVAMQEQIFNACRDFDPGIMVGSATIGAIGSQGRGWMDGMLNAGMADYCDTINFHGYRFDGADTTYENLDSMLSSLQSIVAGYTNKPLWDTEYSTLGEGATADTRYLAVTNLIFLAHGIQRRFWYQYENESGGKSPLTTSGGTALNAAGTAYHLLRDWLVGAQISQDLAANGTVWSIGFEGGGQPDALFVWDSAGNSTYTVPAGYTNYRDLAGNNTNVPGNREVTIGQLPLRFEIGAAVMAIVPLAITLTPLALTALRVSTPIGTQTYTLTALNVTLRQGLPVQPLALSIGMQGATLRTAMPVPTALALTVGLPALTALRQTMPVAPLSVAATSYDVTFRAVMPVQPLALAVTLPPLTGLRAAYKTAITPLACTLTMQGVTLSTSLFPLPITLTLTPQNVILRATHSGLVVDVLALSVTPQDVALSKSTARKLDVTPLNLAATPIDAVLRAGLPIQPAAITLTAVALSSIAVSMPVAARAIALTAADAALRQTMPIEARAITLTSAAAGLALTMPVQPTAFTLVLHALGGLRLALPIDPLMVTLGAPDVTLTYSGSGPAPPVTWRDHPFLDTVGQLISKQPP